MEVTKVRKRATIMNRYNQAPCLTQDTNGEVTTSQLDITNEKSQISKSGVSQFYVDLSGQFEIVFGLKGLVQLKASFDWQFMGY